MSFGPHIQNIKTKCRPRLNTLRALTGTTFGQNKETLTLVYKQYIRSVLDYASPAWAPIISPTLHKHLQHIQNTAFRIALGSTQTTPSSHVHVETKVLSLKEHLDMRGAQFLASALHNHRSPCHHFQNLPTTPRQIANTPYNYYLTIINSIPPPTDPANFIKRIHTHYIPPDISHTEQQLSRADRVRLSRLRCGHHPSLNSYKHRVDRTQTDLCPQCHSLPHTIRHLLLDSPELAAPRLRAGITSIAQLWSEPVRVAAFLRGAGFLA
jgi:hypothetical protein